MPKELKSREEFDKLLGDASEIRVVRHGDGAKVKLRRKKALYTFKTTSEDADAIVKGKKVPIAEF